MICGIEFSIQSKDRDMGLDEGENCPVMNILHWPGIEQPLEIMLAYFLLPIVGRELAVYSVI